MCSTRWPDCHFTRHAWCVSGQGVAELGSILFNIKLHHCGPPRICARGESPSIAIVGGWEIQKIRFFPLFNKEGCVPLDRQCSIYSLHAYPAPWFSPALLCRTSPPCCTDWPHPRPHTWCGARTWSSLPCFARLSEILMQIHKCYTIYNSYKLIYKKSCLN